MPRHFRLVELFQSSVHAIVSSEGAAKFGKLLIGNLVSVTRHLDGIIKDDTFSPRIYIRMLLVLMKVEKLSVPFCTAICIREKLHPDKRMVGDRISCAIY